MTLTREEIQNNAVASTKHEVRDVKEWGGQVRVQRLGAAAQMKIKKLHDAIPKDENDRVTDEVQSVDFFVTVLQNGIADETGELLFLDSEGREFLRRQDVDLLVELANVVLELSGMTKKGKAEAAAEIKATKKKSRQKGNGNSPSASAES